MSFASNHFAQHAGPDPVPLREEIARLRAELAEARALYVEAQEDLNEAVGSVVALRIELAEARQTIQALQDNDHINRCCTEDCNWCREIMGEDES